MGSLLRNFVKWPKKATTKSKSASELVEEKERAQKPWTGKMVKIQVFPTTATPAIHDFSQAYVDNEPAEFDPEKDYAQVLAEARRHLESEKQQAGGADGLSSTASKPAFWLQTSQQLAVYRELEAAWARETTSSTKPGVGETKSIKRWRSFLFWQRSKKHHDAADMSDFITSSSTSIFATPQHPSFKPPRNHSCRQLKQGSSGPIYTDGLPSKPSHRPGKSASGPLSAKLLFYGGGKHVPESPYQPLHHDRSFNTYSSSSIAASLPLYTV